MSVLQVPALSLVVLVGPSGAGKSTFATKHFRTTEVLSSDFFRGLVADDESSMDASDDAFAALHFVAARRLAQGRLTVIDATNVTPEGRKPLVALAREHHALPVAIVLDVHERVCIERNRARPDRQFGPHVVRNHRTALRRSLRTLAREGFRKVYHLTSPEEIEAAVVERSPMWCDLRTERGPFDIVGDVHGCFDELRELLGALGYAVTEEPGEDGGTRHRVAPPGGRKLVFLGDLVDRGPASPAVLRLVMDAVAQGVALCVPGNHEAKLLKKLAGREVRVSHGLERTLEQLEREPPGFAERVRAFLDDLTSHYVLDDGQLVVAHAGMKESMQGRGSGVVRSFALYGETTGETDEYGLPVRYPWAADYRGRAHVVYGHTPVPEAQWLNRTICIDTGCVFGGALTALRWPEKQLVAVPARQQWYEPKRPLTPPPPAALTAQQASDDLLDVADALGRRAVATGLMGNVTLREEQTIPALEAMSRFAIDPKWLVHLPPTMSPVATSTLPGRLEHPAEAFAYFREAGVQHVVCEEKHMGSRLVAAVCRDAGAARRRFGVTDGAAGRCWTRTGRPFFGDERTESALVDRLRAALEASGLYGALDSDWVVLDAELMPWSAKAQALIESQYAALGAAARAAFAAALPVLERAAARGSEVGVLLERTRARETAARRYVEAYRRYCWPSPSLDDLRLAPFHLLASEGRVHVERDHLWHLGSLAGLAGSDPLFVATRHLAVDLADDAAESTATEWWDGLTAAGGEGMVVKPTAFVARSKQRLVQPALKVRGAEYLRIIYGPDYDAPENLERLRLRGLATKRALALKEFALGIEALERFVRREPLRRIHECVLGVLAMEAEPIDPRL